MNSNKNTSSVNSKDDYFALIVTGIIAVLLLTWITAIPPFQNPDEGAHYIKSCASPITDTHPRRGYGHYFDDGMVQLNVLADVQPIRKGEAKFSFEKFFAQPVYESDIKPFYPHAVPNTIIPYALPYLTCTFLQATGIQYQYLFYALRLSFAASFLILIWLAKHSDTKAFLSCAPLLVLPMTINQGAALSADYFSTISALTLAFTAARMTTSDNVQRWMFATSLFLIFNAKVVYLPFAAVLAIPLLRWKKYRKIEYITPAVIAGAIALALQYYYQSSKSYLQRVTDKRDEQLSKLIDHPFEAIQMLMDTVVHSWQFYLKGAIGYAGWFTVPISTSLMWIATATICAWLAIGARQFDWRNRWAIASFTVGLLACAISIIGIFLSMYLYWSHGGRNIIEGVQGRYFIPIIVFIAGLIFGHAKQQPSPWLQGATFLIICLVTIQFLNDSVLPAFH